MAARVRLNRSSLPAAWSLLGKVVRVEGDSRSWDFSASWFAADPRGGALLIGPDSIADELRSHEAKTIPGAAVRLREAFTGRERDWRTWGLPPLPLDWTDAGKAVSILYESDKRNGGGTGKPELFRHPFDPDTRVFVSGPFLSIVGDKLTVDASGVRH